jgi:hypothetical protein
VLAKLAKTAMNATARAYWFAWHGLNQSLRPCCARIVLWRRQLRSALLPFSTGD